MLSTPGPYLREGWDEEFQPDEEVSILELVGEVGRHYGWDYGWWERCGWRQFRGWLRTMNRQRRGGADDPGSWRGRDSDSEFRQFRESARVPRARARDLPGYF